MGAKEARRTLPQASEERRTEMKQVSALMRWVGPVAIVGATFAVISDQLGLVVHLPEAGADMMGYHAVGSGLFLFVLTLLLVGMIGLYAGRGDSSGAKVIEYGDRHARYVLVEDYEEMERTLAPAGREDIRRPVRVPSGGAKWISLQPAKRRREEVETKTAKKGKAWPKQVTS
jgi:hypothetical protein